MKPSLAALEAYVPGEQPQDRKYIKLNTNESPYPPPQSVAAVLNAEEAAKLRLYSDPESRVLKERLARNYGRAQAEVFVSNGSDEILNFAFMAYGEQGVRFADITYGFYSVFADLYGLDAEVIPLREDFSFDAEAICRKDGQTVITNPNPPTGMALPLAIIEEIVSSSRGVVLVDEAYVDFGGESCVPLIDQYENLLVIQTFSKSRQLAGARLGLAMGNAKLIADLNRVKFSLNPYNINRLTLKAGEAALNDTAYFDKTRAAIIETRAWTKQQLEARGFTCLDSRSNFLFASTERKNGAELYKKLKEKGVLVRHFDAPRIANWLRVTIGTPEEMQALLAALDKILEE